MGVLEEITQMKQQGFADNDIVNSLQQRGVSPSEINDALNQSKIKSAVAGEEQAMAQPNAPSSHPQSP